MQRASEEDKSRKISAFCLRFVTYEVDSEEKNKKGFILGQAIIDINNEQTSFSKRWAFDTNIPQITNSFDYKTTKSAAYS